jgi:hypothetical protein
MAKFGGGSNNGSDLYPGFGGNTASFSRLQRLETGSQRLQRGSIRPSAGQYARLPVNILKTNTNATQIIDTSKSQLRKIGGVIIHGSVGSFGYVSSGTSITWYWDGTNSSTVPVIKRADGSSFTVPTAGSGLAITGLANSTDYYFLPFWNIDNLCNIGWVQGTQGTPQIAFTFADTSGLLASTYLLQQSLQGNEPLSAGWMLATTAAGGGSGGGGVPYCVRAGSEIKTLGDLPYECEVLAESEWVWLRIEDGRELYCTYEHPLYHAFKGKVPADTLSSGDHVITDKGEQILVGVEFRSKKCSKWNIKMASGHLYFANGFLSHNQKIFHGP